MQFKPAFEVLITSTGGAASALRGRSSLANDTHPTIVFGDGEIRAGWTEAPIPEEPLKSSGPASSLPSSAAGPFYASTYQATSFTAIGQYVSAYQSVRDFSAAGFSGWTMRHAFFADMGGFVLQPRSWVPFPINAKQLLWLVEHGYVAMPQVLDATAVIRDKNKANGFMRLITAGQITWFCVNIAGRLVGGLALTAVEVNTVAFIYYALVTMFFWRHKPADVETAETLPTNATMDEILLAGGDAAREPYRLTPLDFVSPQRGAWLKYLAYFENAIVERFVSRHVPIDHISSMTTPEIPLWMFRLCSAGVIGNFALFVPSWNLSFPSRAEQILWRIAVVGNLGSLLGGEILTEWVFFIWPTIKAKWDSKGDHGDAEYQDPLNQPRREDARSAHQEPRKGEDIETSRRHRRTVWDRIRNISESNHPDLALPLKAILPMWSFAVIYLFSRAYIIAEDFIEVRSLPLSAFQNVQWPGWFPHI